MLGERATLPHVWAHETRRDLATPSAWGCIALGPGGDAERPQSFPTRSVGTRKGAP